MSHSAVPPCEQEHSAIPPKTVITKISVKGTSRKGITFVPHLGIRNKLHKIGTADL